MQSPLACHTDPDNDLSNDCVYAFQGGHQTDLQPIVAGMKDLGEEQS